MTCSCRLSTATCECLDRRKRAQNSGTTVIAEIRPRAGIGILDREVRAERERRERAREAPGVRAAQAGRARAEARWDPAAGFIEADALEGIQAVIHLAGFTYWQDVIYQRELYLQRFLKIAATLLLRQYK